MPRTQAAPGRILRHLRSPAVIVLSLVVSLAAAEFGARLLARPSERSDAALLGLSLPPERIVLRGLDVNEDTSDLPLGPVVDGVRLTRGDAFGHLRLDPVLGYTHKENVVSSNGWWQSNNIGARSRYDTPRPKPTDRARVLVFGESFTQGSRVRQEDAWPNIIDAVASDLEVVNLAVDGYSMAQAVLRFEKIRQEVDYDTALMMFVPDADLWRDVNIVRELAEPWHASTTMPRFVLEGEELVLVGWPHAGLQSFHNDSRDDISDEARDFLRRYDRFYFPARYEPADFPGNLLVARLVARARWSMAYRETRTSLKDPEGEAVQVSRAMFRAMQQKAAADGARFVLAVMPIEDRWRSGPGLAEWRALVSSVCPPESTCVDLVDLMNRIPVSDIDYAFDGAHFGPSMNRRIAMEIYGAVAGGQAP